MNERRRSKERKGKGNKEATARAAACFFSLSVFSDNDGQQAETGVCIQDVVPVCVCWIWGHGTADMKMTSESLCKCEVCAHKTRGCLSLSLSLCVCATNKQQPMFGPCNMLIPLFISLLSFSPTSVSHLPFFRSLRFKLP